ARAAGFALCLGGKADMEQNELVARNSRHDLDERLRPGNFDISELERYFDELAPDARLAAVRALSSAQQARLYEAAKSARKLTLSDLVPSSCAPLEEVVHEGKNSLAVFTHFAKVFCRPKGETQEVWGYNRACSFVQT